MTVPVHRRETTRATDHVGALDQNRRREGGGTRTDDSGREEALDTAIGETASRTTGRPVRFGFAIDGRHVAVVFEWLGRGEILVVTAYETPERE